MPDAVAGTPLAQREPIQPTPDIPAPTTASAAQAAPSVIALDDQSPFGRYRPSFGARLLVEAIRIAWLDRYPLRTVFPALFARIHPGPVDYAVWGHPVRLYPWNNVCERKALWRPDRFDRRELAFVAAGMRARDGAIFLDGGANVGLYSLFVALHSGHGARILAFEPHPVLFRRMVFNLRPLGSERVRLFPAALGDRDGSAALTASAHLGASRIDERGGDFEVTMRRLPTVLAEHGVAKVDVMKLDVEGFEDRVLQPLFELVPAPGWPRHLLIEHIWRRAWRYDCIERARSLGYRVVFFTKRNLAMSRID